MEREKRPSDDLALELQGMEKAMRANVLGAPATSTALIRKNAPPDAPKFGDVYFGSLPAFAETPHYGMVTRRNRRRDRAHLAPITSVKREYEAETVIVLPAKTLPPKRVGEQREFVKSYILLKPEACINLWITVATLQGDSFRYTTALDEPYLAEARRKFTALRPELSTYLA